jgi:hypothetical protein
MLCGASPIQASSGKTVRHRLNRGGNRQANTALYRIVVVRLRWHQPTRAYLVPQQATFAPFEVCADACMAHSLRSPRSHHSRRGSDGSRVKEHVLVHLTVNANGTVTSSIEIEEFTCP